jgi:pyruvate dehydrogenase (quinone)
MAQTVGDFLVARLHAWGVRVMFGYPGDGINGVFGALNRAQGKIKFVQARHEVFVLPPRDLELRT